MQNDFSADARKVKTPKIELPYELQKLQQVFQFDAEEFDGDIDEIRNEISNKLFDFTERVIEPLVWSHHHSHVIEQEMLSPVEGKELFELYKQIQAFRWRNNILSIKSNNIETNKWIRDLWSFWQDFEKKTTKIFEKFASGWETLKFKKENVEYNG